MTEEHNTDQSVQETANQDDFEQRIASLEQELEEQKNNFLRSMADFKNYKRRTEQEREELTRNANAGLLLKLLPIVDDMERAMAHAPDVVTQHSWFEGVKQVQRKIQLLLESEGVSPIATVGEEFDPHVHEAVMYEEDGDADSNTVVEEFQRGYKIGERVLRPAMVKVRK